jgi:hypothetical protein
MWPLAIVYVGTIPHDTTSHIAFVTVLLQAVLCIWVRLQGSGLEEQMVFSFSNSEA